MLWLTQHLSDIVAILTGVVTVASLVANLTPTDADNKAVGVVSSLVHLLALNFTSGSVVPPK